MKIQETEIRVRYQETDQMGVVYYANYLVWFEVARTEYLRSLGISYRKLEEKGIYLMVASVGCRYKSPAVYDDVVKISSWISEMRNSSLTFNYEILVKDRISATGESVHVFTDHDYKPVRIPKELAGLREKAGSERGRGSISST